MVRPSSRRAARSALAVLALLVVGVAGAAAQDGPPAVHPDPPRCFGAESRDPGAACSNPGLDFRVWPTPDEARDGLNSPCRFDRPVGVIQPCTFGVPAREAWATIALVGDSHAAHWRAALEVVAQEERWHGISLTSGCALTRARVVEDGAVNERCRTFNRQLVGFLEDRPEIIAVFASQHGGRVVVPRGRTPRQAKLDGFTRAFRALPRSVQRVIVLRDTPWSSRGTAACIEQAMAEHRRPGRACALPREASVREDVQALAARRLRSPRAMVVDLTDVFCDALRCYPVIGGVLVHKDLGHITQAFSHTLGRPLLRALRRPASR